MKAFAQRLKWEATLLNRNNLVVISLVVTGIYIGLFQLLKLIGSIELFSILLVLNDPALIGILFVGITILFEKEQGTLDALRITPVNPHHYLLAKVLVLSVLGTACGWVMGIASIGWGIGHFHFVMGLFLTSAFFSNLGIVLVVGARRFIDFALWATGVLMLAGLPLFDWFGVFELPFKAALPLEHSTRILAWAIGYEVQSLPWASYVYLILFALATYFWAYRRFVRSIS